MSKRTHEGPTVVAGFGLPVHDNKRREVDQDSVVLRIDEELNTMRNSKDANVQVRGFVNLWQMAADPKICKLLASTSAIPFIITTMNSNSMHIGIITVALNTLSSVLSNNSKIIAANSKIISSCGGISTILDIARLHMSNEFVCKRVCELLALFVSVDYGKFDADKAIDCVLDMMSTHINDEEVQFAAFGMLIGFPYADFPRAILEAVITRVVKSLHENRADVAVQWKGLVLLRKLLKNKYGSPLLLQNGGVAIVMRALRHHQTHDIICERGFQILQSLASDMTGADITRGIDQLRESRPFNRDISINGGLSVIVGALKCHPNSGTVQLYGCRLLYSILLFDSYPHMKGGVECVLAAMRTYTYDVEIQEYTCRILAILADQGDYRSLIMIEGGVELLLVSMKTHLVSVDINVAACKTLSNLGMLRDVCRERKVLEIIDSVLLAMRVHQQNYSIQKHACDLLNTLADNPHYNREIVLRGGRACVKTAVFTVQLDAGGILQKLSRKKRFVNSSSCQVRPDLVNYEPAESGNMSAADTLHSSYNNHFNEEDNSCNSLCSNKNNINYINNSFDNSNFTSFGNSFNNNNNFNNFTNVDNNNNNNNNNNYNNTYKSTDFSSRLNNNNTFDVKPRYSLSPLSSPISNTTSSSEKQTSLFSSFYPSTNSNTNSNTTTTTTTTTTGNYSPIDFESSLGMDVD